MGGRSRAHATRRDANHDARNDAHGRGRGDTHGAHRQRGARARSTAAAVRGASRRGGGHLGIDVGARIPRATRAINANLPGGGALVGGGRVRQATLLPATIRHVAALEGGYRMICLMVGLCSGSAWRPSPSSRLQRLRTRMCSTAHLCVRRGCRFRTQPRSSQ